MALLPLGIWAASGAGGGGASDFQLISTTVATGTSLTSLTFSSIPSTYRHLELRIAARISSGGTEQSVIKMTFNGDTASNYNTHALYGNGTSALSSSELSLSNLYAGLVSGDGATANVFGATVTQIIDYAQTSKFKTQRTLGGLALSGMNQVYLRSGLWRSTSAVTSLTVAPLTGSYFIAGSRFSLYGWN